MRNGAVEFYSPHYMWRYTNEEIKTKQKKFSIAYGVVHVNGKRCACTGR